MCLSDCSTCKYLDRYPHHSGDIVCGLNPAYANAWKRLKSLDKYSLQCLPIDDCRDFELDPVLEQKEISLSLSFHSWQTLDRESNNLAITKALKDVSFQINLSLTVEEWQALANANSDPYVRVALEEQEIVPHPDPWIAVDSSCIDAIAYFQRESILKIRFNSGQIYQYHNVLHNDFLSFVDADSKGSYFNRHIKDTFPYRPL